MTQSGWRTVAIALSAVLVVMSGFAVLTSLPGGTSPPGATGPAAPNSPSASLEAGASTGSSPSASAGPSTSATPPAPSGPSASPSGAPTSSPTAPQARITFADFRLDARADPDGTARTFSFKTDGPGRVTARLTGKSPQGTTRMCLKVASTAPLCRNWRSGTLTGITSSTRQTTFVVTLIGVDIATPTVDLLLVFRAKAPRVTLRNGRFDGTAPDAEGYNGIGARVTIRTDGELAVKAAWGGKPFDYTYQLVDLTAPAPGGLFPGNGTGIDRSDPVVGTHAFGFALANTETGFGRTPLTLTVSWP